MKYRKIPMVVEAFRYGFDPKPEWFTDKTKTLEILTLESFCMIKTLEGEMKGYAGDYIIQGIKGEIYPCKAYIFEEIYEEVEE